METISMARDTPFVPVNSQIVSALTFLELYVISSEEIQQCQVRSSFVYIRLRSGTSFQAPFPYYFSRPGAINSSELGSPAQNNLGASDAMQMAHYELTSIIIIINALQCINALGSAGKSP